MLTAGMVGPPPKKRTAFDKALAVASTAALLGDWSQTVGLRRAGREEKNPILGDRPSVGKVNTYFGIATGLNLLGLKLPPKWQRILHAGVLGTEVAAMLHNKKRGVKFSLRF